VTAVGSTSPADAATDVPGRSATGHVAAPEPGWPRDRIVEWTGHPAREHLRLRSRGALVRATLLTADIVALVIAFLATELLFPSLVAGGGGAGSAFSTTEWALFFLMLPVWPVMARLYGLYRHDQERTDWSTADDLVRVFNLLTAGTWLLMFGARVTGWAQPDTLKLSVFWVLALASVSVGRVGARTFCRRQLAYVQNAVIVGAGRVGQRVACKLTQHREYGINVVGFVDKDPLSWDGGNTIGPSHDRLLGSIDDLPNLVRYFDVERVVLAFSEVKDERTLEALRQIADLDVQIDVVPRLYELIGPDAVIHSAEGLPLIGLPPVRLSRAAQATKRLLDVVLSALGLLALAPLWLAVAIAIKLDSRGPVFYRQTRMGARSRPFRIFKFRTMAVDADARKADVIAFNRHAEPGGDPRMFKISYDPRVTSVGRFLRRYSIDEFPQLLNVLIGQMSLVGPRPLILDEDSHVAGWARRRLDVKPGMTGLWQVYGGSSIPFGEMVQLDYRYVRTWSVWNDVLLLIRTGAVVLRGSGC
jgi:exopolysaccharide biosynthesis polyprenyl glycosylphosphotransferase